MSRGYMEDLRLVTMLDILLTLADMGLITFHIAQIAQVSVSYSFRVLEIPAIILGCLVCSMRLKNLNSETSFVNILTNWKPNYNCYLSYKSHDQPHGSLWV